MLSVPAPTEVPKELATSLPPMLKAMNTPKAIVVISMALLASGPTYPMDHVMKKISATASIPPKVRCHHLSER